MAERERPALPKGLIVAQHGITMPEKMPMDDEQILFDRSRTA